MRALYSTLAELFVGVHLVRLRRVPVLQTSLIFVNRPAQRRCEHWP